MSSMIDYFSDVRCLAGESPVWDAKEGRLLWADMPRGRIYWQSVDDTKASFWQLAEALYSFGLTTDGQLVVAMDSGVYLFDPSHETTTFVIDPEPVPDGQPRRHHLNDGKVGPDGAFWVGSMHLDAPNGSLYRITPDGRCETKVTGLYTSNGLAFSADSRTMMHTDSRGMWIDRYDFDPNSGQLGARVRIATPQQEDGRPDGGAFAMDGSYWSAGVSAGCLNRYDIEGRLLQKIAVPPQAPTMPCFGGDDMQTVFFTSLRRDTGATEDCGRIFQFRTDVPGVPVHRFGDIPLR